MSETDGPPGLEPGMQMNRGAAVTPRLAATIILLRGGADRLELLLVKRNPAARFMGGVWVFPGGAVDAAADGEGDAGLRAAARRELAEEAGITLAADDELVAFSRWITPAEVSIRFDTWFFLAQAADDAEPRIDGEEAVDSGWFTPAAALEAHSAGEILLVFPTIKHLEQLAPFASTHELLAHARGKDVLPVTPRVVMGGETARILLPGEPGFDEAG